MNRTLAVVVVAVVAALVGWAVWFFFFALQEPAPSEGGMPPTSYEPPYQGGPGGAKEEPKGTVPSVEEPEPEFSITKFLEPWFKAETPAPTPTPGIITPEQKKVRDNFKRQAEAGEDWPSLVLRGTTIVSNYALQNWSEENMGGVALLTYTTSSGWTLVELGGGAPSAEWLVSLGVPESIATQLLTEAGF